MLSGGIEPIDILAELATFTNDPLGFVMFAFPWGEENGPLAGRHGPEAWQRALLTRLGQGLALDEAIREATVSGNGVGKSACVSWIILWATTTYEDTKGVVTANTETQLKTKTWAELGKWFNLFIAKEFFALTATALIARDPNHERTWRVDMVPWSERNVVAFQGLHNEGKRLFMIFDEASGIPNNIWEAGDGCMTDKNTQRIWCVFGNPNAAEGRFRDCAPGGKFSHRWHHTCVDSRTVSFTDKTEFQRWVDDYGEDSDFVRVRVRGVFPRVGSMQFIGGEIIGEACTREPLVHLHDALVIGVDVARFGDNASVIYFRKGRDGRTLPPIVLRGVDTMTLAGRCALEYQKYRADAIFVDGGGVGGGVVDRLRQLQVPVWDIQFGAKADGFRLEGDGATYANKRSEIWGAMREWLRNGSIVDSAELKEELAGPQYGFNVRNEIQLESKDDMRRRGVASPDLADALALTFAAPVLANRSAGGFHPDEVVVKTEYDPFAMYNSEAA